MSWLNASGKLSETHIGEKHAELRREAVLALLGLLWLVLIVAAYYVMHKPFAPDFALRTGQAFLQLAAALAVITLAGGLGRWVTAQMRLEPRFSPIIQACLGLGLVSFSVFLVGSVIGVYRWLAWVSLIGSIVLLRDACRDWWSALRNALDIWSKTGRLGRSVAVMVVLILGANLVTALAPPLGYDALVYHLQIPQQYLSMGRISYLPGNMFWGMPEIGEMLYTFAFALTGVETAPVLGFLIGVLGLAGILAYVDARLGNRAAWVAIGTFLSGFTLASGLSWGYIDWITVLFGLGVLILLDGWAQIRDRSQLWLAAVVAGLALGTKYTAGVLLLAGSVRILWPEEGISWRARFKDFFQFGLIAGLVFLPWLIRNLAATGNPFYPLFFPAGEMDAIRLELYQGGAPWGNMLDFVLLPVRGTLYGVQGAPGYNASIGPLFLGLGSLFWLGWGRRTAAEKQAIRNAGIIAGTGLLLWAAAGRFTPFLLQSRFYFAIFPAIGLLAGAGFKGLVEQKVPGVRLQRVAGALLLFVVALSTLQVGLAAIRQGGLTHLAAVTGDEEYLTANTGLSFSAMQALKSLPLENRALLLWEPRSFYCAPRCSPDEVLDRWLHDLKIYKTPQAVLESWQAYGFSHLLLYKAGADFLRQETQDPRYQPEDWRALDQLLALLGPPVETFGEAYELYQILP